MSRILQITLLGALDIKLDDVPVAELSAKSKALLAYLVCTRQPQPRTHLANLLYGSGDGQARSNLRNLLSELRKQLHADALVIEREKVAFNLARPHRVDLFVLEEALRNLARHPSSNGILPGEIVVEATQAVEMYQGEFLAHFSLNSTAEFEIWQVEEQSKLVTLLQTSLEQLTKHALSTQRYQQGEAHARHMLRLEPAHETAHRYLMELLAQQGRRDEALRQYRICCEMLAEDLDVEPSMETTALYERIRAEEGIYNALPEFEMRSTPAPVPPCPYRGLFAFGPEDHHLFFGRSAFTQSLLRALESRRLVTVIGASGSGKSSVVFAGLLPCLLQRSHENWRYVTFRPGEEPFLGAATALVDLLEPNLGRTRRIMEATDLAAHFRKRDSSLAEYLQGIQQSFPEQCLLIVLDQFEELFTLVRTADVRRQFLQTLLELVQAAQGPSLRLILTLRADFLGQALDYRLWAGVMQDSLQLLSPMTREEMREAIEKPAELHGVCFEARLVDRLLDDIGQEEGSLPLTEFALFELWQRQRQHVLTHVAYEEIGQIRGALGAYADEIYRFLDSPRQEQARRLFIQLVNPGDGTEDTRRRATRMELAVEWPLVINLATKRLVVTNQGSGANDPETVELVHEALIRHWPRLRNWMDEVRTFRSWQERLRLALAQWQSSGQDEEALLRGLSLAEAEQWLAEQGDELGQAERNYIQDSVRRRQKIERQALKHKVLRWGSMAALAVLLAAIVWMSEPRVKAWGLTRCLPACSHANLSGLNLTGADLSEADLSGADFTGSILRRADLSSAHLSEANLSRSDLAGAALWDADLSKANLRQAKLGGSDLSWTNLRGVEIDDKTQMDEKWRLVWRIVNQPANGRDLRNADLRNANLSESYLQDADLRNADLREAKMWGADLKRANLIGARLMGANLDWAVLHGVKINATTQIEAKWRLVWEILNHSVEGRDLRGVDLQMANLYNANLRRADLREANLQEANLGWATLAYADLSSANLDMAVLERARMWRVILKGANLSEATLTGADLFEAVYDKATRWPYGFNPQEAGAVLIE